MVSQFTLSVHVSVDMAEMIFGWHMKKHLMHGQKLSMPVAELIHRIMKEVPLYISMDSRFILCVMEKQDWADTTSIYHIWNQTVNGERLSILVVLSTLPIMKEV